MDPGFPPLEYEELDEVFFEISVLSPPQEIAFPAEFLLGRDGLMLKAGERKAVFLPHIPVEQRWDAFQTAEYLARKAGFSDGSWQGKDVKYWSKDFCGLSSRVRAFADLICNSVLAERSVSSSDAVPWNGPSSMRKSLTSPSSLSRF